MLCEVCQQNPVTVHMQQIINGEKKELHLCQECSSKMEMPISFNDFFQGFIDSIFSAHMNKQSENDSTRGIICPECKMSYGEFKKAGRFGCGACYTSFKKEMGAIFKNIQGSNHHTGKFPHKFGQELLNKRKLDSLRSLLVKAIEDEEYEQAAELRDQIRSLEKGGIEKGGIEKGGIEKGGIEKGGIERDGIEKGGMERDGIKKDGHEKGLPEGGSI